MVNDGTTTYHNACAAQYIASTSEYQIQIDYPVTPDIQLDILVLWPAANHATFPDITNAEFQVVDVTYTGSTPIERWIRAFGLPPGTGTVNLSQASTAVGGTIAGTLNLTGYPYDAEFTP